MKARLEETLARLRDAGDGAFMPFLVIGDPDLEGSRALAEALLRAGADILEFGFAFSDPPADGPVIQAADLRALRAGVTPEAAFSQLAELRKTKNAPFTLLMYYNLILQYGVEAFYRRAAEAGVDAVLIADLPIEEASPALEAARAADIATIFIASELTTATRLARIVEEAAGYLYLVTHLGVTGERQTVEARLGETITAVREHCDLPLLAGFGLSAPEQIRLVLAAGADGAIVGSALIRLIESNLDDRATMVSEVEALASALKAATRGAFKASRRQVSDAPEDA